LTCGGKLPQVLFLRQRFERGAQVGDEVRILALAHSSSGWRSSDDGCVISSDFRWALFH
jgi:hypothetical protein